MSHKDSRSSSYTYVCMYACVCTCICMYGFTCISTFQTVVHTNKAKEDFACNYAQTTTSGINMCIVNKERMTKQTKKTYYQVYFPKRTGIRLIAFVHIHTYLHKKRISLFDGLFIFCRQIEHILRRRSVRKYVCMYTCQHRKRHLLLSIYCTYPLAYYCIHTAYTFFLDTSVVNTIAS